MGSLFGARRSDLHRPRKQHAGGRLPGRVDPSADHDLDLSADERHPDALHWRGRMTPRRSQPAWRRLAGLVAVGSLSAALLAGCAAQMAFREGKQLVETGKVEQGMVKL